MNSIHLAMDDQLNSTLDTLFIFFLNRPQSENPVTVNVGTVYMIWDFIRSNLNPSYAKFWPGFAFTDMKVSLLM